jgi:hypothetical protein
MAMKTCVDCGEASDDPDQCPHCGGMDFVTAAPPPLLPRTRPAARPGLLISVGDGAEVVPADLDGVTLGCNPQSPLHEQFAVYPNVSSFHASVRQQGARLFVLDFGRNGTWHAGTALDPGREQDFDLPVTLRFGSNCYVHFAATTLDEPVPESSP